MLSRGIPFYKQPDSADCGPTCLRMIAKYYGKVLSLQTLRDQCQMGRIGASMLAISDAGKAIGFKTVAMQLNYETLCKNSPLPCIVHWNQNHFVVVFKINEKHVWLADPGEGTVKLSRKDFEGKWLSGMWNGKPAGHTLLLAPSSEFTTGHPGEAKRNSDFKYVFNHFTKHKGLLFQLALGFILGMLLQVILPFLTQSVVDAGIGARDLQFITLLLIGQFMIYVGNAVVEFFRSWILLYIGNHINIAMLADFFVKLMKLPMSYFDVKMTGDIMQRMNDHQRVQSFLTTTVLNTTFSLLSFLVFTIIAIAYDLRLFLIFVAGSLLYLGWISLFLKTRKNLNFKQFELSAANQNITLEMINGMQEIKLSNSETQKRWLWERGQVKLFDLSLRSLFINQMQSAGALLINQGKNVVITFLVAREVVNGHLTLGAMMAIQYIVGQLNSPVQQIIMFIQSLQDARLSLFRINEIHEMKDEEPAEDMLMSTLPADKTIQVSNLNYRYPGADNDYVLQQLNLNIPEGKTTAIVGMSGSGKTTLMKLMLSYYNLQNGAITVGGIPLTHVSPGFWRSKCGVVMQDGYIFSDSIVANIAVGEDEPDEGRVRHAIAIANLQDFVNALPQGLITRIGAQGTGISLGQKQRILIARAVYKKPDYIFFDEATNSLDANNEKVIMENLQSFFKGRTVVIIAHRLSTVKNADQIIVLNKGRISEYGTHEELTGLKGEYYKLVKNQLEL